MTRVAYIGNHVPPFGTEAQVSYGLERVGCEVLKVQEEDAHKRGPESLAEWFYREGIDLTLYTRTHNQSALAYGWPNDGWRRIEARGIVTATLHLDCFVGLEREHFIRDRDPMFTVQHCFTADGSPECAQVMADNGVNHHWLAPGLDERVLEREPGDVPRDAPEIVFVGSRYSYHREHVWRQTMFETLESHYGKRFGWYGNGSPRGTLRGPELDGLYESDRTIVVGDSCFAGARYAYFSDRCVETLGRSGLLLHPNLHGCMYETGLHYVAYEPTPLGLIAAVDTALAMEPDERQRIKRGGKSIVTRRDLWRHRMAQLLTTVGLSENADRYPVTG